MEGKRREWVDGGRKTRGKWTGGGWMDGRVEYGWKEGGRMDGWMAAVTVV